jgi:hypothetical protein
MPAGSRDHPFRCHRQHRHRIVACDERFAGDDPQQHQRDEEPDGCCRPFERRDGVVMLLFHH